VTAIFIIEKLFLVYTIMLFVRIFSSWLPELQGQRWMQFIAFYTDPYLNIFRRIIPPLGMFDLSPIVAFLALGLIKSGVIFFLSKLIV
jgi:YggT family protein